MVLPYDSAPGQRSRAGRDRGLGRRAHNGCVPRAGGRWRWWRSWPESRTSTDRERERERVSVHQWVTVWAWTVRRKWISRKWKPTSVAEEMLLLRNPVRAATWQEKYGRAQFSLRGIARSTLVVSGLWETQKCRRVRLKINHETNWCFTTRHIFNSTNPPSPVDHVPGHS